MPIDNCEFSFKELADNHLPNDMKKMRVAMSAPHSMSLFAQRAVGKKLVLKQLGLSHDFHGCYVLMDELDPVYGGISRSVIQRLIQHAKGKTHFDASLAYRMAASNYPHHLSRGEAMTNPDFLQFFIEARQRLVAMKVAFVEIKNDLKLYVFEAYCSMALDTAQWSSFKTH